MGLILLTGPKHSGKTSAGLALAGLSGGRFADLDEIIAERTGKSPRSLYREGAEVFKKAEAEALEWILSALRGGLFPDGQCQREHDLSAPLHPHTAEAGGLCVIASGGGIIDNAEALALLAERPSVKIVYLEVSAETAWERIRASAETGGGLPPFLDTADPRETHRLLHTRRAAAYRQHAAITIDAENKAPPDIAREILSRLKDRGPGSPNLKTSFP
jgi:shikimate kinase